MRRKRGPPRWAKAIQTWSGSPLVSTTFPRTSPLEASTNSAVTSPSALFCASTVGIVFRAGVTTANS
jgi:hypothetical protein